MIKFESQYDTDHTKVTMELHPDASLTEVIAQFEGFLRAIGYSFKGTLDIIDDENE